MKLAVSNIAWNAEETPAVLERLAAAGVDGVELAPTKIWPGWAGASPAAAAAERARLEAHGLRVPALQAILFDRPELQLFGDAAVVAALGDHVARTAALAAGLGAAVLVFGSPRHRDPGELAPAPARRRAAEVLRRLGDGCAAHGVTLVVEAVPAAYGCTFVTRWEEAAALVDEIDHPAVRCHLDTACTHMAGDDPVAAAAALGDRLAYVHVAEPGHGGFERPLVDHRAVGEALRRAGYRGWLGLEIRRADDAVDPAERLGHAVAHVRAAYDLAGR